MHGLAAGIVTCNALTPGGTQGDPHPNAGVSLETIFEMKEVSNRDGRDKKRAKAMRISTAYASHYRHHFICTVIVIILVAVEVIIMIISS